jgi:hypothetical protein
MAGADAPAPRSPIASDDSVASAYTMRAKHSPGEEQRRRGTSRSPSGTGGSRPMHGLQNMPGAIMYVPPAHHCVDPLGRTAFVGMDVLHVFRFAWAVSLHVRSLRAAALRLMVSLHPLDAANKQPSWGKVW